jgi:hypothetical protein
MLRSQKYKKIYLGGRTKRFPNLSLLISMQPAYAGLRRA